MTRRLRIALAQLDPTVGDIAGNAARVAAAQEEAGRLGADLVVFPELFLVGYPAEDLVLKPAFQDEAMAAVRALAPRTAHGPAILLGTIWREHGALHNAVVLLDGGELADWRAKVDLPNYDVFDEKRVFTAGRMPGPVSVRGVRIGVPICEDMWSPEVPECLAETGAELLIAINGSPFTLEKYDRRLSHIVARVTETGLPLAYLNQLGGQDELVFDGTSIVVNADRSIACRLPAWGEAITLTDWSEGAAGWSCAPGARAPLPGREEAIYQAMMMGLGDYVRKNRFPSVVLGLSGGIDSALTAAVAADALGPDAVHCLMLPSRYTSRDSLEDAAACARALGARLDTVPIGPAVEAFTAMLNPLFGGRAPDTTEENIQSRIRGVTLMAVSNKFGGMLLSTGNKSEMSVGYATLYGDMNGGYNVLKDIYKTDVFKLARWRNAHHPSGGKGPRGAVIPERIITKPPTAELRENQTDQDSLPPYEVLDAILAGLVEGEKAFEEIVADGHDPAVVKRVEHLLYVAEYKRRQAPPGVKITPRSFGRDRRYPITNGFRDAR